MSGVIPAPGVLAISELHDAGGKAFVRCTMQYSVFNQGVQGDDGMVACLSFFFFLRNSITSLRN